MTLPQTRLTRQHLESALQARRLDWTLTTRLPWLDPRDEYAIGPTGIAALDAQLGGGFPRGQLSEIVGARSSGRASVLIQMIASFTGRGELAALIDALDMLDVESAVAAGVDLDRLLWVRGLVSPGRCDAANDRALNQVIKALTLVLQAGNFGLVACDLGEAPVELLQRLPSTTWLRLQRMVEGGPVCVLVATHPMARSAAGLTLRLGIRGAAAATSPATGSLGSADARHNSDGSARVRQSHDVSAEAQDTSTTGGWSVPAVLDENGVRGAGLRFGPRAFQGFDIETRVIRARARGYEGASATLSTTALLHA